MNRSLLALPLLFGAALAPPLLADPEPSIDELKANRLQLDQWRKQPAQLTRLRRDLRLFLALPTERRDQIIALDTALEQDADTARLLNVLDRYVNWLGQLTEADRRAIANTANIRARLALIQDLRDQQWMQTQPRAARERWHALKAQERADYVRGLRLQERNRRQEWQLATHFWKELHDSRPPATRRSELGALDREGVEEYLTPMLSAEEKGRLRTAEGHWPAYLLTLVEIADRHPLALLSSDGPRQIGDLPQAVRRQLENTWTDHPVNRQRVSKLLLPVQAKPWPALPAAVAVYNRQFGKQPLPRELWACNYKSLLPPMQAYVTRLQKLLTDKEQERLAKATDQWPAYPIAIQELAAAHELPAPPWNTALAGPRERWDAYRFARDTDAPAVPRQVLEDFALSTLEPAKLAELKKLPAPRMWRGISTAYREHLKQMPPHGPPRMPHFDAKDRGKDHRFSAPFGRDKR